MGDWRYEYYKCVECRDEDYRNTDCKSCGRCGRHFEEDGLCENVDEFPEQPQYFDECLRAGGLL